MQYVGRANHCCRSPKHSNKLTYLTLMTMVVKLDIGILVTLVTKKNITSGKVSKRHKHSNTDKYSNNRYTDNFGDRGNSGNFRNQKLVNVHISSLYVPVVFLRIFSEIFVKMPFKIS